MSVKLNLAQYAFLPASYISTVNGEMVDKLHSFDLQLTGVQSGRSVTRRPHKSEGPLSAVKHPASSSEMPASCYGREHQQHTV